MRTTHDSTGSAWALAPEPDPVTLHPPRAERFRRTAEVTAGPVGTTWQAAADPHVPAVFTPSESPENLAAARRAEVARLRDEVLGPDPAVRVSKPRAATPPHARRIERAHAAAPALTACAQCHADGGTKFHRSQFITDDPRRGVVGGMIFTAG